MKTHTHNTDRAFGRAIVIVLGAVLTGFLWGCSCAPETPDPPTPVNTPTRVSTPVRTVTRTQTATVTRTSTPAPFRKEQKADQERGEKSPGVRSSYDPIRTSSSTVKGRSGVRFEGFAAGSTIRIYTPKVVLLWDSGAVQGGKLVWPGTNAKGKHLPTGDYFYAVFPPSAGQKVWTGMIELAP